jgi:D-alanyl-D-alanine carboxypeptidase/D-alanyl-D-alanine-endopeptidase (penicillin-binding protein 4)
VAGGKFRSALAKLMRGAGRKSGAWVGTSSGATVFARRAGKRRILASNTKLFTTATAVSRFGPATSLQTTAWQIGTLTGGVLTGSLLLRGDGDPELEERDIETLAAKVAASGIIQVTGPLIYDESAWDASRSVPRTGVTGNIGGELSGLMFAGGAREAGERFSAALRARGIVMPRDVRAGSLDLQPTTSRVELAAVGSATIADLIRDINVPSNNFLAEAMLKAIGDHFGGNGSTAAGVAAMRAWAAPRGAPFRAENGSGLTTVNRASPRAVGKLLVSMLGEPADVAAAFSDSLAVAGQSGTLARRMRGSAAAGRCRGKTGTLSGVSALSGYCSRAGRTTVFSILMNRANVARAHVIQDRMAALVARFSG